MKILFNDVIQYSDAPTALKSPALSDTADISAIDLIITLPAAVPISAVGIGNTDSTVLEIVFNDIKSTRFQIEYNCNGLYVMPAPVTASVIAVKTDATYIGRLAAGIGIKIPTSVAKQPGWSSTSAPRTTLSGQIVPGIGGYNYRTLSLDSRYKMGKEALTEIEAGYKFIGMGYPFFIDFSDETYKLPFSKLYAVEENQRSLAFEGGVAQFLYSYRWVFKEAF